MLGIIFLIFGLNGFLQFLLMQPMPAGPATQFIGALIASKYTIVIFILQVISALLLLANRYVPLALTLLGPVIVNIFFFHLLMAPSGIPLALIVVVLWGLTAYSVWPAFTGLFQQRTTA